MVYVIRTTETGNPINSKGAFICTIPDRLVHTITFVVFCGAMSNQQPIAFPPQLLNAILYTPFDNMDIINNIKCSLIINPFIPICVYI